MNFDRKKERKEKEIINLPLLRVVGFATTKNEGFSVLIQNPPSPVTSTGVVAGRLAAVLSRGDVEFSNSLRRSVHYEFVRFCEAVWQVRLVV